jgi:hypothetical protein
MRVFGRTSAPADAVNAALIGFPKDNTSAAQ